MLPALLGLLSLSGLALSEERLIITPDVTSIQRSVGEEIQLMCRLDGTTDSSAGLMWSKNNGIDKTGHVRVKKLDPFNIALILKNASVSDSGFYQCSASVREKYLRRNVDIFIINELRFADSNSHTSNVMETAAVNISCRVNLSDGEKVKTTWTRFGVPLPTDPKKFFYFEGGAVLEVRDFNPDSDPGEYTCTVFNLQTGNSVSRSVALGGVVQSRRVACQNMCQNFCLNLFNTTP